MSALLEVSPPPAEELRSTRLSARGLCVTVSGRVVLDEVGFDVDAGSLVGIFGPAGAGKSTLIHCLAGTQRPERGTARLDGESLVPGNRRMRARLGVSFATSTLDRSNVARTNLLHAAKLMGVPRTERGPRADELLDYFGLSDCADEPIDSLAPSTRRDLELARALIHRPTLLLLDTPNHDSLRADATGTAGPWDRLDAIRREQELSVLVATRNLALAQRCDRLVILDRGHVIACEPPAHLLSRVGGDVIEIVATRPERLVSEIAVAFDVEPRLAGSSILLEVDQGHELVPRLVDVFPAGRFDGITLRKPNLIDAFFHLTGRTFAEASAS